MRATAPGQDEEEDREQRLVGHRSDLDPPGPRIDVLVDLPDSDSPQEEADDDREGRGEPVRRGAAEGVLDEVGCRSGQLQVRRPRAAKAFVSATGGVEVRDGDERRRQDRQRRVDGRRAPRVAARSEVGPEPLQREPAETRIGATGEPVLQRFDPAAGLRLHVLRRFDAHGNELRRRGGCEHRADGVIPRGLTLGYGRGMSSAPGPAVDVPAPAPGPPRAFHLLSKPTGAVCNLDCAYCFFLSKEMLYPGSRFRMADDLLEAYLRQLIEAHAGVPEVMVAWQGGEPTLMGLDFFRRSVELTEACLAPGQRAVHTIQTNATLIDPEWAAFFAEHDFLVGISIDGPRELHDAYRVNKGGKGSFDQVMAGLGHLRDAGVEWNALTTIHAANAGRGGEVYRFLRDECGGTFVQFIPIIERVAEAGEDGEVPWSSWRDRPLYVQEGDRVTSRSVTAEQYGRFLIDVFEEWVRRDVGEVYVQMFDVALANWFGEPPFALRPLRDVRAGARARAHRRSLLLRPLRRARLPARQHPRDAPARAGRLGPATAVRARQARDPAAVLPRLRRPLRLPRRVPEGQVHRHARRRAGPQLPLCRLQGLLPPPRPAHEGHVHAARPGPRALGDRAALRLGGRAPRSQRPLHLRLGPQVEAVPRK